MARRRRCQCCHFKSSATAVFAAIGKAAPKSEMCFCLNGGSNRPSPAFKVKLPSGAVVYTGDVTRAHLPSGTGIAVAVAAAAATAAAATTYTTDVPSK